MSDEKIHTWDRKYDSFFNVVSTDEYGVFIVTKAGKKDITLRNTNTDEALAYVTYKNRCAKSCIIPLFFNEWRRLQMKTPSAIVKGYGVGPETARYYSTFAQEIDRAWHAAVIDKTISKVIAYVCEDQLAEILKKLNS